ncbi:MAG: hypothetical protein Q4Q20_01815 [Methanocorpusculum sp.]|nr:hypothetical protein [Methanocorpusculum sp.]
MSDRTNTKPIKTVLVCESTLHGNTRKPVNAIDETYPITVLGKCSCKGFDTFGPLKLFGGLNKNHPDADEIRKSVEFYGDISKNM